MNNLTVDHHHQHTSGNARLIKPRKSIIGKLERSSFQAQRLSDVGIAFSQQITAKVGLKLPASQERIVEQTRWLYLRYVFVKLRQNKLPLKDLNLTKGSRSRRAAALLSRGLGGGCAGDSGAASPIVVSISEPPTADALPASLMGDQRPLFTRKPSLQGRPRASSSVFMNVDLNSQDLNLLNARMNSRRNQRLGAALEMPTENMTIITDEQQQQQVTSNIPIPPTSLDVKELLFTRTSPLRASINNRAAAAGTPFAAPESPLTVPPVPPSLNSSVRKYIMDPTINNQILTVIMSMINSELRESKPEFYGDTIYEVIGLDKFSSLESLLDVQRTICQEMTRVDISWDRIVALFSLFGAMSLDCVRLGAPEHVGPILDGFIGFVERDLALWISQQGGWESFLYRQRADYKYGPVYKAAAVGLPILLALIFAYN